MAIKDLTSTQIEALVGTRHETAGFEYPANGLQPYYQWLMSTLDQLAKSAVGTLRVDHDDASATSVRVMPGRAWVNGVVVTYDGGAFELGAFNNDTAYVWLEDGGGAQGQIGIDNDAAGWPAGAHLRLAEVSLAAGEVTQILDRRVETMLGVGVDPQGAGQLPAYSMTIDTQGSVSVPSTAAIQFTDVYGQVLSEVDYLRVRVCDGGQYGNATNATIAANSGVGGGTTAVETITANKDLILQSDAAGLFGVDVADAVAETVTLRIGPAGVSGRRADYGRTLDVTHT